MGFYRYTDMYRFQYVHIKIIAIMGVIVYPYILSKVPKLFTNKHILSKYTNNYHS